MMFDRRQVCLAYYHYATLYHRGQWSPEYAIHGRLDKLGYKPALSEEYVSCLNKSDNEVARAIFVGLAKEAEGWVNRVEMAACVCCGMPTGCDHGESAVALCDCCKEAGCEGDFEYCEVPTCPECETKSTFTDGEWHDNCDPDECSRKQEETEHGEC